MVSSCFSQRAVAFRERGGAVKQRLRWPQLRGAVQQPKLRARCGQLRESSKQLCLLSWVSPKQELAAGRPLKVRPRLERWRPFRRFGALGQAHRGLAQGIEQSHLILQSLLRGNIGTGDGDTALRSLCERIERPEQGGATVHDQHPGRCAVAIARLSRGVC